MIFTPPTTANNYFIMYGKIFYICQHFEKLCKDLIYSSLASNSLAKNELSLQEYFNGGMLINRKGKITNRDKAVLGSILKNKQDELNEIFGDNIFIDKLVESIDNRNYIIHEALETFTSYHKIDSKDKTKIEEIFNVKLVLQKLSPIIESIYYFLALEYESNEKEPYLNNEQKKHYTKLLMNWIKRTNSKLNGENILKLSDILSLPPPFNNPKKK